MESKSIGRRSGMLEIIDVELSHVTGSSWRDRKYRYRFKVRCDCGTEKFVRDRRFNEMKSCGCATPIYHTGPRATPPKPREKNPDTRHAHPHYSAWRGMRRRCYQKTHAKYPRYGGRGITICDRWLTDFDAYAEDIGPRPAGMTLGRIDNDGPYSPENCRWETPLEQARNRSDNITYRWREEDRTIEQWCSAWGVDNEKFRTAMDLGVTFGMLAEIMDRRFGEK